MIITFKKLSSRERNIMEQHKSQSTAEPATAPVVRLYNNAEDFLDHPSEKNSSSVKEVIIDTEHSDDVSSLTLRLDESRRQHVPVSTPQSNEGVTNISKKEYKIVRRSEYEIFDVNGLHCLVIEIEYSDGAIESRREIIDEGDGSSEDWFVSSSRSLTSLEKEKRKATAGPFYKSRRFLQISIVLLCIFCAVPTIVLIVLKQTEKNKNDTAVNLKSTTSLRPVQPSLQPSLYPSLYPSQPPSNLPSFLPSASPSDHPSLYPSSRPTMQNYELGGKVYGGGADYLYGFSVSLSPDGQTLAIASPHSSMNGQKSGHVQVYKLISESNGQNGKTNIESIEPIGNVLYGDSRFDFFGESVSLSENGRILAIGAKNGDQNGPNSGTVKVFIFHNDKWIPLGRSLGGQGNGNWFGESVSLSSDGLTVAVGAPLGNSATVSNSGHVLVFTYVLNEWVQKGPRIDGKDKFDTFGTTVSISSNGTIIAIGGPSHDHNAVDTGFVQIYSYHALNDTWFQLGQDIYGDSTGNKIGKSLSLSSNGNVVAFGAAEPTHQSSYVRAYSYQSHNNTWVQLGSNIIEEHTGDSTSTAVSLSYDGYTLAIGAPSNNGQGYVRVYEYTDDQTWRQRGDALYGSSSSSFGSSVSLSSTGDVLAAGAPWHSNSTSNIFRIGLTAVYSYDL